MGKAAYAQRVLSSGSRKNVSVSRREEKALNRRLVSISIPVKLYNFNLLIKYQKSTINSN
jgi:hypothetical protein